MKEGMKKKRWVVITSIVILVGGFILVVLSSGCVQYRSYSLEKCNWSVGPEHKMDFWSVSGGRPSSLEEVVTRLFYREHSHETYSLKFFLHHKDVQGGVTHKRGIESVEVSRIAYQIDGGGWIELVPEGSPIKETLLKFNDHQIKHREGQVIDLRIELQLNGTAYKLDGTTRAVSKTNYYLKVFYGMGV